MTHQCLTVSWTCHINSAAIHHVQNWELISDTKRWQERGEACCLYSGLDVTHYSYSLVFSVLSHSNFTHTQVCIVCHVIDSLKSELSIDYNVNYFLITGFIFSMLKPRICIFVCNKSVWSQTGQWKPWRTWTKTEQNRAEQVMGVILTEYLEK